MNIGMQGGTVVKPPSNISIEPIASLWSRAKTSSLQPFNLHCGRGTSGGGVSARGRAQQALRARACGPLRSSSTPPPPSPTNVLLRTTLSRKMPGFSDQIRLGGGRGDSSSGSARLRGMARGAPCRARAAHCPQRVRRPRPRRAHTAGVFQTWQARRGKLHRRAKQAGGAEAGSGGGGRV